MSVIVDVSPRRFTVMPGVPQQIQVTVTNTGDVIGGYALRILGADPGWVETTDQTFSLFPEESRTLSVAVTVPQGIPAGERRIAVQLRELTPPEHSSIDEVVLVVPDAPALQVRADPMAQQTGRSARFSLLVDNTGNTLVRGRLAGTDAEGKVRFAFSPADLTLAPGEHAVVDLKARARQPFFGQPAVRSLSFFLDPPEGSRVVVVPAPVAKPGTAGTPAGGEPDPGRRKRRRGRAKQLSLTPERDTPALANATLIQRPLVGRGSLSLLGLLVAVTVFAVVITLALSKIVGQSAADRDLALQIASAGDGSSTSGTSSMAGTVRLLTSGTPVPGVAVTVYGAADTNTPLATTATGDNGTYTVGDLPAGDYKLTFRGAGFVQLWYPQALEASNATTVTLTANQQHGGLDVSLGGVPATVSGTVKGDDVSNATLTLRTPGGSTGTAATGTGSTGTTGTSAAGSTGTTGTSAARRATHPTYAAARTGVTAADATLAPPPGTGTGTGSNTASTGGSTDPYAGAIVTTVPIGADGTFTLANVPSPSVYEVEVSKPGYATSTQLIDVSAGETRTDLDITLRKGDGLISGTVNSTAGPLGDVTLTATSGQTTVTTISLDKADGTNAKGSFVLRSLPTPAQFTIVATADGYASQTMSVSLAAGQSLTGVSLTLGRSSGSLSGTVTLSPSGDPAAGVGVLVTDGSQTIQTATQSSGKAVGTWRVDGLALPGTYTLTFARSDLASHTLSVSLDADGNITPASIGPGITTSGISVALHPSTAVLYGVVKQKGSTGASAIGEATVQLSSGTSSYTVTTASVPASSAGAYRIEDIPPGTYTVSVSLGGVTPTSSIVKLAAGDVTAYNPKLEPAASITGTVVNASGATLGPGYVVELYQADAYPNTVYRSTTTRSDGTFSFTNVDAPQTYVIQVRPTSGSAPTGTTTLQLAASQALNVKVKTVG
ncbi:carboxypeptidase-like regulatory domain-containing protein [Nocardioides sp. BP30]|uniref:carboxypeptidase-like regulatory domain-containing protein n=1 Tax=Nocardioides sp. BP30 TaxID=3036374 RepID=UPI0024688A78|nr:carboxypeptidase-like regulatory domain-containing protein [Nocardioides sp. BP30]WGL52106.1 carboxypeptidase-like regulatory domain-containing protein [Nocardioides sp. BP30]